MHRMLFVLGHLPTFHTSASVEEVSSGQRVVLDSGSVGWSLISYGRLMTDPNFTLRSVKDLSHYLEFLYAANIEILFVIAAYR